MPDIYKIDPHNIPRPLEGYEFDWAGFQRKETDKSYIRVSKRHLPYHVSGDFEMERELLKNVQMYPPSCACQTKVRLTFGHYSLQSYKFSF